MKLDRAYFDKIRPTEIRGKFYKKTEIDSILNEIGINAELQQKEIELLQLKLENAMKRLNEVESSKESTRALAQSLIQDARAEADKYVKDASEASELILKNANSRAAAIITDAEEEKEDILSELNEEKSRFIKYIERSFEDFFTSMRGTVTESYGNNLPEDMGDRLGAIMNSMDEINGGR